MLPPQPTCYTAQNNAEGSSADALVMRLIGLAKTRIVRENGHNNNRSYYGAREEFLSFEFQLTSFGGKAAAGSHNFTFSLVLPPGLPSSMKVSGHGLGSLLCAFVRAAPLDEERLDIVIHYQQEIPVSICTSLGMGFTTYARKSAVYSSPCGKPTPSKHRVVTS